VERLWDDIATAYDKDIQVPGKEAHFLILIAFVSSFGFIRFSAHMIRAQVSWWPGNVETKSGTHIHHMFWGILLLITMGYIGIATSIPDPWFELVALAFGIGMGLTMDEFALWLNLEDVYWKEKGRESIDAVVVTVALLVIALLGLQFWIDVYDAVLVLAGFDRGNAVVAIPIQLVGIALAVVCFRRGRKFVGLVGLFVPLVALVGALVPSRRQKPASSSA
jgi:lysyl-tRNA synthetase, class II